MRVTTSYAHGIRKASGEGRMLLLLWLFNLVFASAVYSQFSSYFLGLLETRAAGANFLKAIDFNTVFEMLSTDGGAIGRIISLAFFLMLAYGFFSIFLSGGILHTLWARYVSKEFDAVVGGGTGGGAVFRSRRMAPLFFQGAGRYFGRFLRLFLFSLVLWAAAIILLMLLIAVLRPLTSDTANEKLMFWVILGQVIFGLFLAFLVKMILDYARIRMVVEDSTGALGSLVKAARFVFRRLGKTLALYWLYMLTGAVLIVAFCAIDASIKNTPMLAVLVAFLIGQIFILSRGWIKVGLQAAQMEFFRSAVSPAKPAPAMEIRPPAFEPFPPQTETEPHTEEPPKTD